MPSIQGPSLELQTAIVAAWKANVDIQGLIGNPARINPQQAENWPGSYIEVGEGQELPDDAECIEGAELFFDVHIWSRADTSFANVNKIAANLWAVLSNATLTLSENRLVLIERNNFRRLRDPDGETLHGVLTLRALTEPA